MQKCLLLFALLTSICSFSQKKFEAFFDFNKDKPNDASQIKINQWISDNKDIEVTRILGYCDSVDDSQYNKELAMRRVNSMLTFLKNENIKIAENVELKSFGKDFKKSKNQDQNRKVEVFYNVIKDNSSGENKAIKDFEYLPSDAEVEAERFTLITKFKKSKEGDIIRINSISFFLNSEKIIPQSQPILEELYQIMVANPKLIIEIHGHICCNPNPMDTKLSFRRAIVIFKYLTNKGIPIGRLSFKGYGSNDPIYKVPERNEKERAANRRVEILIVQKP